MFKVSMVLVLAGIVSETALMATNSGRIRAMEILGMIDLGKDSQITILLGADFFNMAAIFLIALTVIATGVCAYINYVLTKPPRIFYEFCFEYKDRRERYGIYSPGFRI